MIAATPRARRAGACRSPPRTESLHAAAHGFRTRAAEARIEAARRARTDVVAVLGVGELDEEAPPPVNVRLDHPLEGYQEARGPVRPPRLRLLRRDALVHHRRHAGLGPRAGLVAALDLRSAARVGQRVAPELPCAQTSRASARRPLGRSAPRHAPAKTSRRGSRARASAASCGCIPKCTLTSASASRPAVNAASMHTLHPGTSSAALWAGAAAADAPAATAGGADASGAAGRPPLPVVAGAAPGVVVGAVAGVAAPAAAAAAGKDIRAAHGAPVHHRAPGSPNVTERG